MIILSSVTQKLLLSYFSFIVFDSLIEILKIFLIELLILMLIRLVLIKLYLQLSSYSDVHLPCISVEIVVV